MNTETKTIASVNIESMNGTEFATELGDGNPAGGHEIVGPLSVCPRPGDASITMATPLRKNVAACSDLETSWPDQPDISGK